MFSYVFMKILEMKPRSYDKHMDMVNKGCVRAVKEAVVSHISAGSYVLEIGCGTGELAAMLIARGATVTGFDVSPAMVGMARDRIRAEDLKDKLTIKQMGVDGMDGLPTSAFDAVVSTLVFSELSDDERRFALKQSERVLKPGGVLVIADEVVPRTAVRKVLQALARIPMLTATYLVSRTSTHPIADLPSELKAAGFTVQKEIRSQGDTFALVVAVCEERNKA